MKIKVKNKPYFDVASIIPPKHKRPMKQSFFFRLLLKIVSLPDLIAVRFKGVRKGMDKLGRKEPCLYLMNHSSFVDLEIASSMIFPRRFSIVCTSDGFIGKDTLMRLLGCIEARKFIFDITLVRDIMYAVKENKSSILMYPEASYSFDGTATPLPDTLGAFVKMLKIPVVIIKTEGAFARQPLYNNLIKRKVKVGATMEYVLSADEINEMSAEEINAVIGKYFEFDNFRWQQENKIKIDRPDRADSLHRVLYKCPSCLSEGKTEGKGIELVCHACGKKYALDEYGFIGAREGDTEFSHIPDWYAWERESVRREIEDGSYRLDTEVDIYMMIDTKCIYRVGEGRLTHTKEGFLLEGCDSQLSYSQKAVASYSLYSDFYWYELGDVISIGNQKVLYYCIPKSADVSVAKTRLATEEIYKIVSEKKNIAKA